MDDEIVISGISGRFPESDDIYEFWEALVNGVDLTTSDNRRWPVGFLDLPPYNGSVKNIEKFDADFFKYDDATADATDPQLRIFHEVVYEAIIDAGLVPNDLRGSKTGIILGLIRIDTSALTINEIAKETSKVPMYTRKTPAMVSQFFGFNGPAFEVESGCASSSSALIEGSLLMKSGQCDKFIIGGAGLHLAPSISAMYKNFSITSPDGRCKSLDASCNGFCRSEAVVAMLVEKKNSAKRIYASIRAIKTNTDGFTFEGITFPNQEAQTNLLRSVIRDTGLDPSKVNYIEGHITGTAAGDKVECRSLLDSYRNNSEKPIMFGCLKSNIGHTEESSAICAIFKVALIFQKHCIPPNINYVTPNPNIPELLTGQIIPVVQKTHFDDELIPINSFGIGGVNTHMVLQANKKVVTQDSFKIVETIPRLILISGRTEGGLEHAMNWILENRQHVTKEFLALLNDISKTPVETGMHCRAYMIIIDQNIVKRLLFKSEKRRPVWFVFSGLGAQWRGMLNEVVSFPIFSNSLHKCAEVLSKVGMNLFKSIENNGDEDEVNIITALVSTVCIQIAFVDLLYDIGLKPDGIIGHSIGEISAAYADGCLTLEEAVLTSFYTAKLTSEYQEEKGAMAQVGINWEEMSKCLSNVTPAFDNSAIGITVSGSKVSVLQFVQKLHETNVVTKVIHSCEMAFHSPLVASSSEILISTLKKVITSPKLKSNIMISTSTDAEQVLCDATYFASNIVSPVMFRKAVLNIPQKACIVEIGPSAILHPILRLSHADSQIITLMQKDCRNNTQNILTALGHIYCGGNNVNIEKLYPKVDYPVPRETLSLSHLLKWDHSQSYFVASYTNSYNDMKAKTTKSIDLLSEEWSFITDHCVNGKIIFPAMGYLYIVWCQYSIIMTGKANLTFPVEFKNVVFEQATEFTKSRKCDFEIAINEATGQFMVAENGSVRVTGHVAFANSTSHHFRKCTSEETNVSRIKQDEIYKEFENRGYDYGNNFQMLQEATADGCYGKIKWTGNWITFIDSVIQLWTLSAKNRLLLMPRSANYILCNPKIFYEKRNDEIIDVVHDDKAGEINTHAFCMKGLKLTPIQRRKENQKAKITYQSFSPYYFTIETKAEQMALVEDYFVKCITLLDKLALKEWQITHEEKNCRFNVDSNDFYSFHQRLLLALNNKESTEQFFESLKGDEKKTAIFQTNYEEMIIVPLKQIIENTTTKLNIVEYNNTSTILEESVVDAVSACFMEHKYNFQNSETKSLNALKDINLIIYKDESTELITDDVTLQQDDDFSKLLQSFDNILTEGGFLLLTFRSKLTSLEKKIFSLRNLPLPKLFTVDNAMNFISNKFRMIGKRSDDFGVTSCIFKKISKLKLPAFVKTQYDCYVWVEKIKSILKEEKEKVIWLLAKESDLHGLMGFIRCLKKEEEGERFRCFISDDEIVPENVLKDDLLMNYVKDKCNGVNIQRNCPELRKEVEHSHLDIKTKGDLDTFQWHESSHNHLPLAKLEVKCINVYYSALNFKDVLIACGKIPHNAYPQMLHENGNLGMEYSGIDQNGNRVMGIAKINAIATTIVAKENDLCWPVPNNWSLKEAATVPIAFITVYYALITRAKVKANETVLIHSGSGGVGQAAITVCLAMNCKVFTSVGTEKKKQFLKDKFPQLQEYHFVNSREASFDEHILKVTSGKGVDVVLNSLTEDKLRASINCLSEIGRFVEIGKSDMLENNALDSSLFGKNQSFHSICIGHLIADHFTGKTTQLQQLYNFIETELNSGIIQPLNSTVFGINEVEKAFRYMSSGKHIGKVLIMMRDENAAIQSKLIIPSIPHTYCNSSKVYIIIGGLGGLGLQVAYWLSSRGAKNLVITSRTGIKNDYQRYIKHKIEEFGVTLKILANDGSTYEKTRKIFDEALCIGQIVGIFNLAMVVENAFFVDQTSELFKNACAAKINTALFSDQISREMNQKLDYFVCFSSLLSCVGLSGRTNYGFSNSVLESICVKRRKDGLHGVAIQLGAVGDTSKFSFVHESKDIVLNGLVSQKIPAFLEDLETCMNSNYAVCATSIVAPKMAQLVDEKRNFFKTICQILEFNVSSSFDDRMTLAQLGMDSLMATEVKVAFEQEYNMIFSTKEVRQLTIKVVKEFSQIN